LLEELCPNDPVMVRELKSQLNIAKVQIENQKMILEYQDDQMKKKDIRIDKFLAIMESAIGM